LTSLTALRVRLVAPSYHAIFKIALQFDLSFYDTAYLELAMRERLHLASLDQRLCAAATVAGVPVYGQSDPGLGFG